MIHRHGQLVLVDPEVFGDQLPRIGDRLFLEVIAKAEVAEHLKKRVVTRRVANIVQIVVLAARAHTFLRCRRAVVVTRLNPRKQVLELHHARVDEHKRRVIARHKRA